MEANNTALAKTKKAESLCEAWQEFQRRCERFVDAYNKAVPYVVGGVSCEWCLDSVDLADDGRVVLSLYTYCFGERETESCVIPVHLLDGPGGVELVGMLQRLHACDMAAKLARMRVLKAEEETARAEREEQRERAELARLIDKYGMPGRGVPSL